MTQKICLHLGCGKDILHSDEKQRWYNLDKFPLTTEVGYADITHMIEWEDHSVDHIKCHHMLEHLDYMAEKCAWKEMTRILKPEGTLEVRVPDFLYTVQTWMDADDDWKGFFKITEDRHDPAYGFGHGPGFESKWGVLLTWIFGSQSRPGLYHLNAYSEKKLKGILEYFHFEILQFDRFADRDAMSLQVTARKGK